MDCEAWRAEINLDDLVPTWDFVEKEEMFKYYPQYYHKTDKVVTSSSHPLPLFPPFPLIPLPSKHTPNPLLPHRTDGQSTSSSSAAST